MACPITEDRRCESDSLDLKQPIKSEVRAVNNQSQSSIYIYIVVAVPGDKKIDEQVNKRRSLAQNINNKDVENENSAGGTYCCGIIRKCSKKRISWALKSLFITSIKYVTRKREDSVFSEQGYGLRRTPYRGSLLASLRSIFV